MKRILLSGCNGKMGRIIAGCVRERRDCTIVAGIDPCGRPLDGFPVFTAPSDCAVEADVIIDFSHPDALEPLLQYAAAAHLPAALLGYPNYGQCEQDRQHQQGDDTAYSDHKKTSLSKEFQPQYTPFDAEEQSKSTVAPNFLQKSKIRACIWACAVI